jgi:LmbE family N-acetylglucosaminyl deacetylase
MSKFYHLVLVLLVFFCASASLRLETLAQVRPVYDRGATGLLQILKKLNSSASVLMIGAHPDDEDTALLAYLARGENARTAYLSLTRGDGGQNIIGSELGESLGLIRTEELIQARRLDGAEQFFTRAYDYGFSKTLAEAKQKWDEKLVLCDAVRVIRNFRPLVVVAQFSGTPADGHGQHQFAGYIAPLAVKAAADPAQCSEAGQAWTVRKVYARHRGQGDARLRINTGKFDPVLGRSYFEIAMEARSQHKSQEQGVLELRGDQFSGLNLMGSEVKELSLFEGLDLSMTNSVSGDEPRVPFLNELREHAKLALNEFDIRAPEAILPHLVKGYDVTRRNLSKQLTAYRHPFLVEKERQFADAIVLAAGIQIDALADRETVVPGETVLVAAKAYTRAKDAVKVKGIRMISPERWSVVTTEAPRTNSPGFVTREVAATAAYFNVTVAEDWHPTEPYWLIEPRDGDLFRWNREPEAHTLPLQPSAPKAAVTIDVLGSEITIERPVEFRFADDVRGEIRRNLAVVPSVSVDLDQSMMIVPYSLKPQTRRIVMTLTNHSTKRVSGNVALNINSPTEWKYTASSKTFEMQRAGERTSIAFEVTIPARTAAGSYQISGNAMIGESLATSTMRTVAYPHIQTHRYYRRAVVDTKVIELKTAPVTVGYLAGSGDRVPEAIRQMGFDLEMISENELASGRLARFDVIVVGIRAYQVRPDVVANNKRLLDYARDGGTLIVQYQLPAYAQQNLTPFPTQMGPRVADENAAMKVMVPEHPILNFPNKITQADFEGWVQERNLYNFSQLGTDYVGLIESHDTGEAENSGGLVIAKVGKGNYIYCSYSMFRQLPAGVGGAYRLFANLLSLPKAKK